jgi:hypothetical protein
LAEQIVGGGTDSFFDVVDVRKTGHLAPMFGSASFLWPKVALFDYNPREHLSEVPFFLSTTPRSLFRKSQDDGRLIRVLEDWCAHSW